MVEAAEQPEHVEFVVRVSVVQAPQDLRLFPARIVHDLVVPEIESLKATGCPICLCTWVGLNLVWVLHHLAQLPNQGEPSNSDTLYFIVRPWNKSMEIGSQIFFQSPGF